MFWRKRKRPDLIYDGKWLELSNPELAKQAYPELGEVCEIELYQTKIENTDNIKVLFAPAYVSINGFENRAEFETMVLCHGQVLDVSNKTDNWGKVSQAIKLRVTEVVPASEFPQLIANTKDENWAQFFINGFGYINLFPDEDWIYLDWHSGGSEALEVVLLRERGQFTVIFAREYFVGTAIFVLIGSRPLDCQVAELLAKRLGEMGEAKHWSGKGL